MHNLLTYPFNPQTILKKRKSIRRELLASSGPCASAEARIDKKIAVLGGSTTHDIISILELFLLDFGIKPEFYESEFGLYYEDAMFSEELSAFAPDLIYIHTSRRNIAAFPAPADTPESATELLNAQYSHFETMWEHIAEKYRCPVIQNNFELPFYRLLGNRDAWDHRGQTNFITRLNTKLYEYAAAHQDFYINDINYLSADYGLLQWSDPFYWHMYKYCLNLDAVPAISYNVACIIKSIYGKNKKALVLDLDNTLWGGVVGDDGVDGIEIGRETSMGQVYSEFQDYLKELRGYGVMLNVDSKNDEENALAGLNHPEGSLRPEDFISIKANWDPKDLNFTAIAQELNILPESMVFIDDNPAERAIVTAQVPGVSAPVMDAPEHYITALDRCGFFEATKLSKDDLSRNEMYKANTQRAELQKSFANYEEYLLSLEMRARIRPFEPVYIARIAQLTNKSNQFNLTTRRFTESEMQEISGDNSYITLYGRLTDKFGDNGVISVVLGRKEGDTLHIELWLMSCRVLKRSMEHAMLDQLVHRAQRDGVKKLRGYYYKTQKNGMVKDFYKDFGFELISSDGDDTVWELPVAGYTDKNKVIRVNEDE